MPCERTLKICPSFLLRRLAVALTVLLFAVPLVAGKADPSKRRVRFLRAQPQGIFAPTGPGATLHLHLFDDVSFNAIAEAVTEDSFNGLVWRGRLEGVEDSSVILVVDHGVVVGNVWAGDALYLIRYVGQGFHAILERDPERLPELREIVLDLPEFADAPSDTVAVVSSDAVAPPGDGVTTLDLLTLYTKAAAQASGGRRALRALIKLRVAIANTALEESKVDIRIRLVKTRKVSYEESEFMGRDLNRLRGVEDGYLQRAHTLRDKYGADFVSLYVQHPETNVCGAAFIGWSPLIFERGLDPAASAFSVIQPDCQDRVLAHELGHNMGLNHARGDFSDPHQNDDQGAFPYSYGFKSPSAGFYTVMSLRCPGCREILHFSSPRVRFEGHRTGVKASRDLSADAARSLNRIREGLAQHRSCTVDCNGTP